MTGSNDERRGSRRRKSARLATLIGLVLAVAASATVVGAGNVTPQTVLPVDVHNTTSFWTSAAKPVATPGRTVAVHAARFLVAHPSTRQRSQLRPRARAGREHSRRRDEPARRLAAGAERRVPAVRGPGVADHGAGARGAAPRDQDLQRARARRPGRDDPRRPDAARLPRLGALGERPWYVDPYYSPLAEAYTSYYARDVKNTDGMFVEREPCRPARPRERSRPRRPASSSGPTGWR